MSKFKFFNGLLFLIALFIVFPSDSYAQRRRGDAPLNNRREVSPDSLKSLLRARGTEGAFFELIKRRVDQQLRTLESTYFPLEFNPDSVSRILTLEIQDNSELVSSLIVDLALGRGFSIPVFTRPTLRFDGSLSSGVERELFELQWNTPNKAPLTNIKARRNDFDRDLEQILVNEVHSAGLAEGYFRERIFQRARLHMLSKFTLALSTNDDFAERLGGRLENYLLSNLKVILSRKNVSELVQLNSVIERYVDRVE
ncbi:MAG: hypothetical protein SFU91_10150 [Chloroherpetonaceae bacterium]|nr:hypothetical protein [Chloroherpetonaceae bacterium]